MKLAIVGSRNLIINNIDEYLPDGITEIVSGGAKGIDSIAAEYAKRNNIPLVEFRPEYKKYRRAAPLKRNELIAEYADEVLAFWDGSSKGTLSVIKYAEKIKKPCKVIIIQK